MEDLLQRLTTPYWSPKPLTPLDTDGAGVICITFLKFNPKFGTRCAQLSRALNDFIARGDFFIPIKEGTHTLHLLYLPRATIKEYQEQLQAVLYQLKMNVLFYETSLEGQESLAESKAVLLRHPILIEGSEGFQQHLDEVTAVFYQPMLPIQGFVERENAASFVWAQPDSPLDKIDAMVTFLEEQVGEYENSRTKAAIQAWQGTKNKWDSLFISHG